MEKKYVAEHVETIVKTFYAEALQRMADPKMSTYVTTICNYTSDRYQIINEAATAKICDLFPDFHVEGSYRVLPCKKNWFNYEIRITW